MRARRVASLLGALLVVGSVPASPSQAQTDTAFVGYDAVATGNAFTAFPSVPALLPVEAPFEATLSLATATLSSGGQGFGRASTFFPGTPIVGIRPLIEIGSGQRLPIPDYPIVVESREFEPAKHDEQPAMTMSSDVDADRAVAIADVGAVVIPGVVGVRSARTVSTSLLDASSVSATSVTTLNGIEIAGVVRIDSLSSVASVTSDATTATCEGGVTVSGLTVNGQPATLDDDGLHLGGGDVAPGPGLDEAVGPLLEASGITIRPLGGTDGCPGGATGSRTTAGLLVSVPLPSVGAVPPGGHFDIVLASTSASAGASVLPDFAPPPFEPTPVVGDVVSRAPGPLAAGAALPPVAPPAGAPTPDAGSRPTAPLPTDDVAYSFAGVPAALLIGLFLLALAGARRVRRYMERIFTLVAPT